MKRKMITTSSLCKGVILLGCTLGSISLSAQKHVNDTTLNRTVVVEQQYNPHITDAQKVNVLPDVNELTATPNEVEYDKNIAPASTMPGTAMAAYAGVEKQDRAKQGYARLGYGNRGNLDAEANYLFNLTPKDKLNLSLTMVGMNGKRHSATGTGKWNSHYYRTQAGVDYLHQFGKIDMNIAGNFGLSNLNYRPFLLNGSLDRQKFTSGDFHIGLASVGNSYPLQFNLETNLLLYSRAYNDFSNKSINETIIRTKGYVIGNIGDNQKIGVAFGMNNLFYNEKDYDNYTTLLLNPYYEWAEEDVWKLHAGANVDLGMGFGKTLRVSPDLKVEYIFSDSYVLYANATGGRNLNDFRKLEQYNPYGILHATQKNDSYEWINTALGFKASPVTGLWFNIYGGYQNTEDDLYLLGVPYQLSDFYLQDNSSNVYAGAAISGKYKDIFHVFAEGRYSHWKADDEGVLWLKPEFQFDFQTGFRPIPKLNISLDYQYIRRAEMKTRLASYREKAINNLSAGASYNLFEGISIYVRMSNLLNKKLVYYNGYPTPGFNFVGGLIFSF